MQLKKTNFRGSNLLENRSSTDLNNRESIGHLIYKGVSRQKAGIIKEHQQIDLYQDKHEQVNDEEDNQLDENEFIPLGPNLKQTKSTNKKDHDGPGGATILDNQTYR